MRILLGFFITLLSFQSSAKDWNEKYSCGSAIVDISISEKEEGIKIWEVELKIRSKFKKENTAVLNYEQVYFSCECLKTSKGKDYFVFQAYCSGSGCADKDNWGVVDNYGNLILVPNSGNSAWKDSILLQN